MATLHINIEKIISQKIEEKINEMVNKAFSNISIDSYEDIPDEQEADSCKVKSEEESDNKIKSCKNSDNKQWNPITDTIEEVENGWVARLNAYKYIIDEMKKQLTEEQIKQIATPASTSIKEYAFKRYIEGLTWEDLNDLFKDNKYLKIDINSEDLNKGQLETYGTTPTDIYYNLLRQIINDNVYNSFNLKYNEDSLLSELICKELRKDFESRLIGFTNYIIENYHLDIFNEIFGSSYYLNSERNADLFFKNIFKDKIVTETKIVKSGTEFVSEKDKKDLEEQKNV